jgi:glucans biosynthesis protein
MELHVIDRRLFLGLAAAVPSLLGGRWLGAAEPTAFNRGVVVERARALAAAPFAWPEPPLTSALKDLSYSQYQGIRFREDRRLFTDPPSGFSVDLFHSGFIFNVPVEIFLVEGDQASKLAYDPGLYTFQDSAPPEPGTPLEFAGFRARTALNKPDVMDEFLVFAGASYFRAVAKDQIYGLSARGLAVNTATEEGEEFPFFRAFWLEQPGEGRMVVHALLDGPSVSGAFRFTIRPGAETQMDVEATLFARADIASLGIGPLTSMHLYDSKDRYKYDDFRPSIHDSDGLAVWNGSGERLWRPLHNPERLQLSGFNDNGPRGFGLIQRERRFSEHEDLEAAYHKRPSLWVEPIGDWGKGAVVLVEIPTQEEIHDNIVAFWRPEQPLLAGTETNFTYRLHWGWDIAADPELLRVVRTLSGRSGSGARRFVIDFSDAEGKAPPAESLTLAVHASAGTVLHPILMDNSEAGAVRAAFELDPGSENLVELRVDLSRGADPAGESWLYRWTA